MPYYLHATSTRHKGRRYVRGQQLPDDIGAELAERGLAVDDRAKLTRDRRPITGTSVPHSQQRTTLASPPQDAGQDPGGDSGADSATNPQLAGTSTGADGQPSDPESDPNADPDAKPAPASTAPRASTRKPSAKS